MSRLLQAIIGNYAVPILEEKQVWGTSDQTRTAYLDSTDVARMTLASLRCVPKPPPASIESHTYAVNLISPLPGVCSCQR